MAETATTETKAADTTTAAATTIAATTADQTKGVAQTALTAAATDTTTAATDTATATKGYWPDDWQKRIAGDDEKELKQIARYTSPAEVWKKARALEQRLSSGELKPILPKDAKPEEITAWRKDNGIPEKPDGYELKDITIPEGDKPLIDAFLANAHANHFTPDQAKAAVKSYYDIQTKNEEAVQVRDEQQRTTTLDALNAEWGRDFRRNVGMVEGLLAKFPESVRDALKSARLPDGTALFNNSDALKGFAALALEMNPAGIYAPAGGGDLSKTAIDEYKDIQKTMREDRTGYNKDKGKQDRMVQLIEYLSKNNLIDGQGNIVEQRKAA